MTCKDCGAQYITGVVGTTSIGGHACPSGVIRNKYPRVVLCGSFHRAHDELQSAFHELTGSCFMLSPKSLDFADPDAEFVISEGQEELSVIDIEEAHRRAIASADFVWLHAPDGYVGLSAAMEIGFAFAIGVPVFGSELPEDVTVREYVRQSSIQDAIDWAELNTPAAPSAGLDPLQSYYERICVRRGWAKEGQDLTLKHIRKEVEELMDAIADQDDEQGDLNVQREMADIILYLLQLANIRKVNLSEAVVEKEAVNRQRFDS